MRWSYLCLARSHTTDKTSHRPMLMGQISSKSMVRRLLPGVLFLRRLSDWEVQVQEQDKIQQETKPEPHNLGSSWGDGWVCSLHCKTSHSEDTGALWPGGSQNVTLDKRLCLEGGVDVGKMFTRTGRLALTKRTPMGPPMLPTLLRGPPPF